MSTSFTPPAKLRAFRFLFIDEVDYRLNMSVPTLTRRGIRKFAYAGKCLDWSNRRYTSFQLFTMPHTPSLIAGGIVAECIADCLVGDNEAPLIPISHEMQGLLVQAVQEESGPDKAEHELRVCSAFFEKIIIASSSASMMVFVGTKPLCWMLANFLDQHFFNQGTIGPNYPSEGRDTIIGVTVPFFKTIPPYFHRIDQHCEP